MNEFWDEVQREVDDGEFVVVASSVPLDTQAGWIPVDRKLPPNASLVLAWDADEEVPGCVIASYQYLTRGWVSEAGGAAGEITHWQPLPLPPSEENPAVLR